MASRQFSIGAGGVQIRVQSEAVCFLSAYCENTRLGDNVDQIDVAFVEHEATPRLLMKLGIQLYLATPVFKYRFGF